MPPEPEGIIKKSGEKIQKQRRRSIGEREKNTTKHSAGAEMRSEWLLDSVAGLNGSSAATTAAYNETVSDARMKNHLGFLQQEPSSSCRCSCRQRRIFQGDRRRKKDIWRCDAMKIELVNPSRSGGAWATLKFPCQPQTKKPWREEEEKKMAPC